MGLLPTRRKLHSNQPQAPQPEPIPQPSQRDNTIQQIKNSVDAPIMDDDEYQPEELTDEEQYEEDPQEQNEQQEPVNDKVTVNGVILNHEQRLRDIESMLFRLKNL